MQQHAKIQQLPKYNSYAFTIISIAIYYLPLYNYFYCNTQIAINPYHINHQLLTHLHKIMGARFQFETTPTLNNPNYSPQKLLDHLIDTYALKNDAALCRFLSVAAPVISKLRHKRIAMSDAQLLVIHETTDIPLREIKAMLGIQVPPPEVMLAQAQERANNIRIYTQHANANNQMASTPNQQAPNSQPTPNAPTAPATPVSVVNQAPSTATTPEPKQTDYISPL